MPIERDSTGGDKARETIAREAYITTTLAVSRIARETGTKIRRRKIWPGAESEATYAEPGAGLRIARAVEQAAAQTVRDYVRYAREDGYSWQQAGAVLELGAEAAERGISMAQAAFEYAAGPADPDWRLYGIPAFRWSCYACGRAISDRGPADGHPERSEHGHREGCTRLAATTAAWVAESMQQS